MDQQRKIQHLFWRAGFGLSPAEWAENQNRSIPVLVEELLRKAKQAKPLPRERTSYKELDIRSLSQQQKAEKKKEARKLVAKINLDWLERMGKTDAQLLEKMTLFWHNHFACQIKNPDWAIDYLNVIRKHALGNFGDLVLSIAKTPAMIRFLNNQQNRKQKPNENFARELMELFTIGRGNYTEQDVKEAARAFTGWTSNQQTFEFRERWHDYGAKSFMTQKGNWNGDDIINILLEQKETARFIVRKLYRYFVNERIDDDRVEALALLLYETNYDIGGLMKTIFTSDWFYSAQHTGAKIKSPVEYLAGMSRGLGTTFEDRRPLLILQKALGQVLLNPPNVAGWPGGKAWIDNATLLLRLNLPHVLLNAGTVNVDVKEEFEAQKSFKRLQNIKVSIDLNVLEETIAKSSGSDGLEEIGQFLLTVPLGENKAIVKRFAERSSGHAFKSQVLALLSIPEYQIC